MTTMTSVIPHGRPATGPRVPCRVFSGFLDVPDMANRFFAAGRPGAYLAVERPAAVSAGDE